MSLINFVGRGSTCLVFEAEPWVAHEGPLCLCRQYLATLHFRDLPGTVIFGQDWLRHTKRVYAYTYVSASSIEDEGGHWSYRAETLEELQRLMLHDENRIRASKKRYFNQKGTIFEAFVKVRDRYHLKPEAYSPSAFREKIEKLDIPSFNYSLLESFLI
jgi:hypothetical protein